MNQSEFNVQVGDKVLFLGKTDTCFEKNGKYRILTINKSGEYPFNSVANNNLLKNLKNPLIFTIKDKNNKLFILIFTDDGFYHDDEVIWSYKCNFDTFTIERKLRKEKL